MTTSILEIEQVLVSKNTHFEWLNRGFTSSEKVVVDNIPNLVLGDVNDEENYDLTSKVVVVEEEMET